MFFLKDLGFIIGKGNERYCYLHPDDASKVIKVEYRKKRNQNKLEDIYYRHLLKKNASFEHIAKLYSCVETDMGRGLVYQYIRNYDGSSAITLLDALTQKIIEKSEIKVLLNELYSNLKDNGIVLGDINLANIFCVKSSATSWKLVVADGVGPRHWGLKFWLYIYSSAYSRYKLYKGFQVLMNKVNEYLGLPE